MAARRSAAPRLDHDLAATGRRGPDVWDLLRTLVKHRWWAASGFIVFGAPMAAVTLLTTPVYRATTRLLLAEETSRQVALGAAGSQQRPATALDPVTRTEVVRSRAIARDVALTLKLWEAPEFAPFVAEARDDDTRAQRLVDPVLARLDVQIVPDSQVIAIAFEATDPALAARTANQVATRYIDRERESRFAAANSESEWLSSRLAEQRQAVEAAETALQTYRAQRDALSLSDRQNIVVQKLADLNASVTKAKTDRILRETQYQQLRSVKDDAAALEAHPLVAGNAVVQGLKAQMIQLTRQDAELANRLGPKHPDRVQVATAIDTVQARLRAEVAKVVEGLEAEFNAAVAQEESLTRALNQQKSEAFALDQKGVEYAALEREAASARQVFDALLQQTRQATLSNAIDAPGLRIVDQAEPPGAPVRPRRRQGLAAAGVLGILGAMGAAMGREALRRRIQSPRDIEEVLGLPLLALIPPAAPDDVDRVGQLPALPAEAFRRLRASVLMNRSGESPEGNVLVVTSAAPGDGKTFVSAHLAAALASVNQRVVLIDADLRRPRLHSVFGMRRGAGLADALHGRRPLSDVVRKLPHTNLTLLPAGIPDDAAPDLLSMPAFRELLVGLRRDYQWVVIDSPPVMPVADASVLAHDASAVLFVASAELTSLEAAETALAELDAAGARMLGAVLNRAPITREAFYYSRYYNKTYGSYVTGAASSDSEPSGIARLGL